MTHQKIETKKFVISYCDCNEQPTIQVIDNINKIITPMSVETFLEKIKK